jgi:hypothetical protein
MKITKQQLKQIVKEEFLKEIGNSFGALGGLVGQLSAVREKESDLPDLDITEESDLKYDDVRRLYDNWTPATPEGIQYKIELGGLIGIEETEQLEEKKKKKRKKKKKTDCFDHATHKTFKSKVSCIKKTKPKVKSPGGYVKTVLDKRGKK